MRTTTLAGDTVPVLGQGTWQLGERADRRQQEIAALQLGIDLGMTLIELLQNRASIQEESAREMKAKFEGYSLDLQEVLIGTPSSPEDDVQIETILTQLRSRQIAAEQIETYDRQEKAAVKERELREAESRAQMQTSMTQSELNINIQSNEGKAEYQRSIQQASQIRALAEAEAEKIARIGIAQALATEEQVRAYGGPQFQVTQQVLNRFSEAVQQSKVDVVPRVIVGATKDGGSGNIMEALMTMLLSDRFGALTNEAQGKRSEEAEQLRSEIRKSMTGKTTDKKE